MTLKDGSSYYGQGDKSTKTANGFGQVEKKSGSVLTNYMGQWQSGVASGWGLMVQQAANGVSAYRGNFENGVPSGAGTGWNWDKTGKL